MSKSFEAWWLAEPAGITKARSARARDHLAAEFWGVGLSAVVLAFFSPAYLALISPKASFLIGLALATSIFSIHRSLASATNGSLTLWGILAAVTASGAFMLVAFQMGYTDVGQDALDQRCLDVEIDMLSARPTRTDAIEIYKALDCKSHPGIPYERSSDPTKR